MGRTGPQREPDLAWDWRNALFAAACALPAALLALDDVSHGLALAVGMLPAALVGLLPTRRARLALVPFGLLVGASMFLGGLLASLPALAVAAVALLGPASAVLAAARPRLGLVAMQLALPMVGIGFSFSGASKAAGLAGLMVVGSAIACLVSLAWPEVAADSARPAPAAPTLEYGVRLGAAGATAAAIGFALDFDHVGWACAAALLVMRPAWEMQRLRSVGRIAAVAAGAVAGIVLTRLGPPAGVYGAAAVLAVAAAAGTHRSRWYVTSAFTTFLVFLLLLHSHPHDASSRFGERLGETLLGVGLAYAFALVPLPRRSRSSQPTAASSASTNTPSDSRSPGTR
jgi:hypothetical protein